MKAEVEALAQLPNGDGQEATNVKVNHCKVCSPRLMKLHDRQYPHVRVQCLAHEGCRVQWRIHAVSKACVEELTGDEFADVSGLVVYRAGGQHAPQESDANKKWVKLKLKRQVHIDISPYWFILVLRLYMDTGRSNSHAFRWFSQGMNQATDCPGIIFIG